MDTCLNTSSSRITLLFFAKKLCRVVVVLTLLFTITVSVSAQVKVYIKDIKKIHLIDAEGALGFSRTTEFDILNEEGQWICNQTKQNYRAVYAKPADKALYEQENAIQHKFVKKVDQIVIKNSWKQLLL